jgi:hypothetical protein
MTKPDIQVGDKVIVDKPFNSQRLSDIKEVHTSINWMGRDFFTVAGYSKYLFSLKTMQNIGVCSGDITVKLLN